MLPVGMSADGAWMRRTGRGHRRRASQIAGALPLATARARRVACARRSGVRREPIDLEAAERFFALLAEHEVARDIPDWDAFVDALIR